MAGDGESTLSLGGGGEEELRLRANLSPQSAANESKQSSNPSPQHLSKELEHSSDVSSEDEVISRPKAMRSKLLSFVSDEDSLLSLNNNVPESATTTAEVKQTRYDSDEESLLSIDRNYPAVKKAKHPESSSSHGENLETVEIVRPKAMQSKLPSFGSDDDSLLSLNNNNSNNAPKSGTNENKLARYDSENSDAESLLSIDRNYPEAVKKVKHSDSSSSSRGENLQPVVSLTRHDENSPKTKAVRRLSKKQRDEVMKQIKSKTERIKREAPLKLPYHRPEAESLDEFLNRRNLARREFQDSLGSNFKLKGFGALRSKAGNKALQLEIAKNELTDIGSGITHDCEAQDSNILKKLDGEQVPFSSKVDEWMKEFATEDQAQGSTTGDSNPTPTPSPCPSHASVAADVEPVLIGPKEPLEKPSTLQIENALQLEQIHLSDSDDNLVIDEEIIETVDLTESQDTKRTANANLENSENRALGQQVEVEMSKAPIPRKTIAELLKSLPNYDKIMLMKPTLGLGYDENKKNIDLKSKSSRSSNFQQKKMQDLMERFAKHSVIQRKPKEQHFTVHVAKKEEDSQGQEKIIVNEVDYVEYAKTEVDDEDKQSASPSPGRQAPGAKLVKLRADLRAQIMEKKKREYNERMKRHAIDSEGKCLDTNFENEEEEIMEDDDMTESEPELTDEEELENMLKREKKNRKKKSAFVDDEAVDEEEEENVGGLDEDEDSETGTDDDEVENEAVEDDLLSVKSDSLGIDQAKKMFSRVIHLEDSSDEEIVGMEGVAEKENVEVANKLELELSSFKEIENEPTPPTGLKCDTLSDKQSQQNQLETDNNSNCKPSALKSLNSESEAFTGNHGTQDSSAMCQDINTENASSANDTLPFSPSLSIDSMMPPNWRTPRRTPSEIEKLFSPLTQITPTMKFSGQINSQLTETPSPAQVWAAPRPDCRLGVSPTLSLCKVNSEIALDYFLQDNPSSSQKTPNPIPKEITSLFAKDTWNASPLTLSKSKQKEEEELLALCSGVFPSQTQASPIETQHSVDYSDDEAGPMDSNGVFNKTPKFVPVSRQLANGDETPKASERALKTTRLFFKSGVETDNAFDEEDDEDVKTKVKVLKKRKRLEFSDDEAELDETEENLRDVSEGEENQQAQDSEPEYDDEENEIPKKPSFKGMISRRTGRIRKAFVEAEAELSGSEEGSGDEDERGLDQLDEEEGDIEDIDEDKLRDEIGREHLRQVLDDDQRHIRLLQEALLEDGDLHTDGKTRERQFKWKNVDDAVLDDMEDGCLQKDYVADETELQKQKEKIEKMKWLNENSHLMHNDDDDASQNFLEKTTFLKMRKSTFQKIQNSCTQLESSVSMSMTSSFSRLPSKLSHDSSSRKPIHDDEFEIGCPQTKTVFQSFPSPEDAFAKVRKGSFLNRGSPTLSRLAEMTKINDVVSNVKNNSRNFVFSMITPPAPSSTEVEGNHSKKPSAARRATLQPAKKVKIDRSFSSLDSTRKEASIFKWFS